MSILMVMGDIPLDDALPCRERWWQALTVICLLAILSILFLDTSQTSKPRTPQKSTSDASTTQNTMEHAPISHRCGPIVC